MTRQTLFCFLALFSILSPSVQANTWWAYPYLQNVTATSADLYWFIESAEPMELECQGQVYRSQVREAPELVFNDEEVREFPELAGTPVRYRHQVSLRGLPSATEVTYRLPLGDGQVFESRFQTLDPEARSLRFVVYADSETEPESLDNPTPWPTPKDPKRRYLVDQVDGYRANLRVMLERQPSFVAIAGDLVESGGEQRDWDEFWRMNTSADGANSVGSRIPILPAIGNHEYFAGPRHGRYETEPSKKAIAKYFTYFHPSGPDQREHYYSKIYPGMRILFLDSVDGLPHQSENDPNFFLEAAPEFSPGIGPEGPQYSWLERELQEAQREQAFTFVVFHHCPYSSGPHGKPPGTGPNEDTQSGVPLRLWTPLFMKYGVQALLCGHDEMLERSEVEGTQILPDGTEVPHTLQVYDVGIGGDGLRPPEWENPYRKFLAYEASPEIWEEGVLIDGGRHYGHLEVNLNKSKDGWQAEFLPVYVFPISDGQGGWRFERRIYDDKVVLQGRNSPKSSEKSP